METALLQALGIASGGILAFGSITIVLLLLNTPSGPRSALAYVLSYTASYLSIGWLSLWIQQRDTIQSSQASHALMVGPFFYTTLGLMLLFFTFRQWRHPPDLDAPSPNLFAKLDTLTPIKSCFFGVMVTLLNGKNLGIFLSAIAVIASATMTRQESMWATLLVTFVFCAPLVLPLLIYFLMPKRSKSILGKLREKIERHRHRLMLILLPLFGIVFLIRGLKGFPLIQDLISGI